MLKRLHILVAAMILTLTAYGQADLPSACQGSIERYWVKGFNGTSTFTWSITDPKGISIPISSIANVNAGGDTVAVNWNFPGMVGGVYTMHVVERTPWGCVGDEYTQNIVVNTPQIYVPISAFTNVKDNIINLCKGGTYELEVELKDNSRTIISDLSKWTDLQEQFAQKRIISAGGTYTVKIVDDLFACSFDTVNVISRALPGVSLGNDFSLCGTTTVNLTPNTSDVKYYTWLQDGAPAGTGSTFTVDKAPTSIILSVEDQYGCTNSDTLNVTTCDIKDIRIPAAFTPNNDGYNDKWEIPDFENKFSVKKITINVYSRWGKLVYQYSGEKYKKDDMWDGKDLNGNPLPVDSYHYVIGFSYEGQKHFLKGPVTIIL